MFLGVFKVNIRESLTNAYILLELQREAIWALNEPTCISVVGNLRSATLETVDRYEVGNSIPN